MSQQTARRGGAVWALVITSVAGFMAALDNLVVTTALPSIRKDLGGALDDLEWTVSAYTLTFAVLLMFGAALGDRFGRRRLFLVGLTVFTGASAAAAMAPGIDSLIAARAVQGVGAAIMMPLTLTLLTAAVPAARRGMAYGIWGAVNGLAVATGPLIGGSLTEHVSWHWIFWLNVPLGLALLPLARLRLAESYGTGARLDVPGTLLASGGLFGIVYALVRAPRRRLDQRPVVLTGLFAGGALLAAFVAARQPRQEPDAADAALPLPRLRRDQRGQPADVPRDVRLDLPAQPVHAGRPRLLAHRGGPADAALDRHADARRADRRLPLRPDRRPPGRRHGPLPPGRGPRLLRLVVAADASYAAQLPALIISGIGMALYFAPASNLVMSSVRPQEQGIASGANNALREVGGALGIAVMASIFSAQGGYETAQSFVDGLRPALVVGAATVAVAGLATLAIPRAPRAERVAPAVAGGTDAATGPVGETETGRRETGPLEAASR